MESETLRNSEFSEQDSYLDFEYNSTQQSSEDEIFQTFSALTWASLINEPIEEHVHLAQLQKMEIIDKFILNVQQLKKSRLYVQQ
ncbi:hypothetical protein pb186bvf_009677 [Paramecium bursaria]